MLSAEQIKFLENGQVEFEVGFPISMINNGISSPEPDQRP
uniref:Putative Aldo/keto reductase n=1 Tax=Moniliophthora roreri TaxID=221103 RepID=A0A0W0G054_MONRR